MSRVKTYSAQCAEIILKTNVESINTLILIHTFRTKQAFDCTTKAKNKSEEKHSGIFHMDWKNVWAERIVKSSLNTLFFGVINRNMILESVETIYIF